MAHRGASAHISYRGKQWPVSDGLVGLCYRSGEVVFVADVRQRADYALVNGDVVAEMAVPIRMRGRVFGVLNLEAADAAVFAERERMIFTTLADQVGGAIHLFAVNRRLLQTQAQAERRGEELTAAREHLRRAVVKLDRRAQRERQADVLTEAAFVRQLSADLRAVARGGRALLLATLALPADGTSVDGWQAVTAQLGEKFPDARLCREGDRLWLGMPQPPEPDERDSVARLAAALQALPQPLAADVSWLHPGRRAHPAELMRRHRDFCQAPAAGPGLRVLELPARHDDQPAGRRSRA
jgi:GAF domain-containing protein